MIRRESLKLLSVGTGAAMWPFAALASGGDLRAVFDARFSMARAFAAGYANAYDCQHDAATLWFAHLWPQHRPGMTVHGLTTAADAMILADCARRERLAFRICDTAHLPDGLIAWDISERAR